MIAIPRPSQGLRVLMTYLVGIGLALAAPAPVFDPANQPIGWVGEVEVTNFNFSSGDELIFQTSFEKSKWSGDLFAYPVSEFGNVNIAAERWGGAADQVNTQNWDTERIIVTMKKDGTRIPFRWASLESHQQAALGDATKGPKVLNYIRGDRSNELPSPGTLRTRASVLGDIVHSRPLYVYDPTNPRVYVGGNDGMLHVFDAIEGNEVWAYIPSMLIPKLLDLTVNPYVHTWYVDASPNAREVTISGVKKRILVGGLGAGGQGLYALDITDPNPTTEATAASKILWEITNTTINNVGSSSYSDLGYTYGIPVIAQLNDGTWAAIVGNGYSNTNGGGDAVLYVINLQTGALIKALVTQKMGGADNIHPNGLSSPAALDVNGDGKVDYVYAGDINGNLWKFDLRSSSSGSWPAPLKIFTTPLAAPSTQAIVGAPAIAPNPAGGYMIAFGTGRMFTDCTAPTGCDRTDTTQQYAFGLWDNDFPASGTAISKTIDSSKLVSQSLSAATSYTSSTGIAATIRTSAAINAVTYTGATPNTGWRLALANTGERVVGDGGLIANGRFHFSAVTPNYDNGAGNARGDNWLIEVDYLTGMAPSKPFFDLDASGQVTDDDRTNPAVATQLTIPIARRIVKGGVMSQPILATLITQSQTYFNMNPDATITASTTSGGVSNGHFDFDIYYTVCQTTAAAYKCPKNTHVHQYDDKYNVTGVDMLNASLTAFNLPNAIPSTATKFKILMANQRWSPAVQIKVGDLSASYVPVHKFLTPTASSPPPALDASNSFTKSLPTWTRATLKNFVVNMPLDAFSYKDWAGTGDSRVGVVPTQTGCVHANKGGFAGGPWMNGALTIQIIKDTTPDSAIHLSVAGDPKMGYRLKTDAASAGNQIAEYTLFWHHPNKFCVGDAGWGTTAAIAYPDTAGSATAQTPAPGSTDPKDGTFGSGGSSVGSGGASGGSSGTSGGSTTTTITLDNGTEITQTITYNADGTVTVTVTGPGGTKTTVLPPASAGKESDNRVRSGRVSWKQLIRP